MGNTVGTIHLGLEITADIERQVSSIGASISKALSKAVGNINVSRQTKRMGKDIEKDLSESMKNIKPNVDFGSVTKNMKDVGAEASKASRIYTNMSGSAENLGRKLKDANATATRMNSAYNTAKLNLAGQQAQYDAILAKMDEIAYKAQSTVLEFSPDMDMGSVHDSVEKTLSFDKEYQKLTASAERLEQQIAATNARIGESGSSYSAATGAAQQYKSAMDDLGSAAKKTQKKAASSFEGINKSMGKSVGGAVAKATAGFGIIGKLATSLGRTIKRAFKAVFLTAGVYAAFRGLQNLMQGTVNQSRSMSAALQQVKTNLAYAFTPIYNAILPALSALMRGLATVTNAIASFIGGLFGRASKSAVAATKSIGGVGAAVTSAGKAAKKASRGLAAFDKLNVLQKPETESGGGGGGGGGGAPQVDLGDFEENAKFAKAGAALRKFLDGVLEKISKYKEPIKNALLSLMSVFETISPITIAASLGFNVFAGALTHMYLTNEKIATQMNGIWTGLMELLGNVVEFLSILLVPVLQLVGTVLGDLWHGVIEPFTLFLTTVVNGIIKILNELWKETFKPITKNIAKAIGKAREIWTSLWTNTLQPVFSKIFEVLTEFWADHLQPTIKKVGIFVGKLIDGATEIWNEVIAPIIMWLTEKLGPVVAKVFNAVIKVIGTVGGVVADVFGGVMTTLGGVVDFITGIFTGDWKKAWNGVKDIFKGIVEGLGAIFKTPLNFIIRAINKFIGGLNKIKIPKWVPLVGGKGFNIGTIPELKVGMSYVPSDEFPALLHKGEAVLTKQENKLLRSIGGVQALRQMPGEPELTNMTHGVRKEYAAISAPSERDVANIAQQRNRQQPQNHPQYTGDFVIKIGDETIGKVAVAYILEYIKRFGDVPFPVNI